MRNDAQDLEQKQKQLSGQLENLQDQPTATGLRSENNREQIQEQIGEQRERLDDLLNQMRQTVEEAETAEPLLAQKLYDSFEKRISDKWIENLAMWPN